MYLCIYEGCNKYASCNYINEKKRLYCSTHKLEGMIDIMHKKCIYKGCNKYASCNYINEKKRLYCSTHKLEGMVNINNKKYNNKLKQLSSVSKKRKLNSNEEDNNKIKID